MGVRHLGDDDDVDPGDADGDDDDDYGGNDKILPSKTPFPPDSLGLALILMVW